jgi:hypothetical protein
VHPARRLAHRLFPARGAAALPAVALALLAPAVASAETPPVDAPEIDARTPPLPPEYLALATEWASVGYHPSTRERVRAVLPRIDEARRRLAAATGAEGALTGVEIRVAAIALEMQHLSPGDTVPAGRVLAFPQQRLVVVAAEPDDGEDDLGELIAHGLAHLALGEATSARPVPAWFAEGFADATSGTASRRRLQALALAAMRRDVPSIAALRHGDPSVSPVTRRAVAADLVSWLEERGRGTGIAAFAAAVARDAPPERAIEGAAGAPIDAIEDAHRESLARRFGFAPVLLLAAVAWLVVATLSLARRARRALAARRAEAALEPAAPPARARRRAPGLAPHVTREADAVASDPGVPKVRRDGGWHTLH